jgi:3-oxoadipate enol-lactonase
MKTRLKPPGPRTAVRLALAPSIWAVRTAASAGARRVLPKPAFDRIPDGRMVELPGRGSTFVIDVPGPTPTAPTVVLLHALGCTAYLSWAMSIGELSRTYRVITLDQRWHGRGIRSARFRFSDCADDVAALMDALGVERAVIAGYSMGGAVAQLMWRQHAERVSGLVLCSTARNYRGASRERLFFPILTAAMHPLSGHALTRVERLASTLPEVPSLEVDDPASWGRSEFRSTSAWSMPEVLGELGRFNSAAWIGGVDVPTAVVVTTSDHTIPERRQRRLASAIDGATVHEAPGGHASIVLGASTWVPVFLEAVADVVGRTRDEESLAV